MGLGVHQSPGEVAQLAVVRLRGAGQHGEGLFRSAVAVAMRIPRAMSMVLRDSSASRICWAVLVAVAWASTFMTATPMKLAISSAVLRASSPKTFALLE